MKNFIFIFLLFLSINSLSQNAETKAYNKVKELFTKKCLTCIEGHTSCSIYYNKSEKALDIANYQIPILNIRTTYDYNETIPNRSHYVKFECIIGYCIFNSKDDNKELNSFSISFDSKNSCYEFIDAFSELKEILEK